MYSGFSLSTNIFELVPEAGLARGCALSRVSCPSPFSPPDWSQDMVLSKQVAGWELGLECGTWPHPDSSGIELGLLLS